jgi:hypothetical protein
LLKKIKKIQAQLAHGFPPKFAKHSFCLQGSNFFLPKGFLWETQTFMKISEITFFSYEGVEDGVPDGVREGLVVWGAIDGDTEGPRDGFFVGSEYDG